MKVMEFDGLDRRMGYFLWFSGSSLFIHWIHGKPIRSVQLEYGGATADQYKANEQARIESASYVSSVSVTWEDNRSLLQWQLDLQLSPDSRFHREEVLKIKEVSRFDCVPLVWWPALFPRFTALGPLLSCLLHSPSWIFPSLSALCTWICTLSWELAFCPSRQLGQGNSISNNPLAVRRCWDVYAVHIQVSFNNVKYRCDLVI